MERETDRHSIHSRKNDTFPKEGVYMKEDQDQKQTADLGRRNFVAMTAGVAATAVSAAAAAELPVVETDVDDQDSGRHLRCRIHSSQDRSHPGVLIWPDAFGLRPSMRDMGKRGSQRRAIRCWCPTLSIAFPRRPSRTLPTSTSQSGRHGQASAADGVGERARRCGEGCHRLRRLPGRAKGSQQVQEDRHPGLLHGRTAGDEDCGDGSRSHRRRLHRSMAAAW